MPDWKIFSAEYWKKKKKSDWLILVLAGVLLFVLSIPTTDTKPKKQEKSVKTNTTVSDSSYRIQLQDELQTILEQMKGVGKVEVMITMKDDGERIIEKEEKETVQTEQGKEKERQREETSVMEKSADTETPYVKKETKPAVEGVFVVADGGGSAKVKEEIMRAVLALFSVEAHKIVVVERNS
ncbi:MAG: stage III sporulation protein AG [Lachnospiraceae bacterium]